MGNTTRSFSSGGFETSDKQCNWRMVFLSRNDIFNGTSANSLELPGLKQKDVCEKSEYQSLILLCDKNNFNLDPKNGKS